LEAQQSWPQQVVLDGQQPQSSQHFSVDEQQAGGQPGRRQQVSFDAQKPPWAPQHTLPAGVQRVPAQHTRPCGQQLLPQHVLPAAQHSPPQHTLPDGQQKPLQQVAPDGQAVSQLPQLLVSVLVSTQLPRQLVRPTGHCVQGPEETVQPWFWTCMHDTQSLWDSDDPETSRHEKPLHQTWAEYGNVLVGTPTLRAGNCC
jgi:hypothetical protein